MRQLNGVYTQAYNRHHNRPGHVFQGRYKAILVQKESHFLEVCRYVVLNPVRARAVRLPEEWRWSSYQATAGRGARQPCLTIEEILSQFEQRHGPAQQKYREFVRDGMGRGSLWDDLKGQSVLGEEGFVEGLMPYVMEKREIAEIPKGQRYVGRPSLEGLFNPVQKRKSARNKKIVEAVEKYGYSQVEVASHLKLHYTTVSRLVNGR